MSVAFVDTSCLVAVLTSEPSAAKVARRVRGFQHVFAAALLEAELRCVAAREGVPIPSDLFDGFRWVMPDRRLTTELDRVLQAGYVRGADAWHLACALYLADLPAELTFVTMDTRQRTVAAALGFSV